MNRVILLTLIFIGCSNPEIKEPVINRKEYTNIWGAHLPTGICKFTFKKFERGGYYSFEDSCKFYQVGDRVPINIVKNRN